MVTEISSYKTALVAFILLFVAYAIKGQDNYSIINWGPAPGLPKEMVSSFIKDKDGFLWMGTWGAGLIRFDGSSFTTYIHESSNPNSLLDDTINNLKEDSLHRIWIGTSKGLSMYDPSKGLIETIHLAGSNEISSPTIIPFWATRKEVYCINDSAGIQAYNITDFSVRPVSPRLPLNTLEDGSRMLQTFFDSLTRSIWFIEYDAVTQYSMAVQKFQRYPLKPNPTCISFDKIRHVIWVGGKNGLDCFSINDKKFQPVEAVNNRIKNKELYEILSIHTATDGKIWMYVYKMSKPGIILIYNPDDHTVDELPYRENQPNSISPALNGLFYCDNEGIVWGVKYDRTASFDQIIHRPVVFNNCQIGSGFVINFSQGLDKKIWLATNQGLVVYDLRKSYTHNYRFEIKFPSELSPGPTENPISALATDTILHKAWVGYFGGASIMHMKTLKSQPVIFKDSNSHIINKSKTFCRIIYYDENSLLLYLNYHIYRLNKESTTARQLSYWPIAQICNPFKGIFFARHAVRDSDYIFIQTTQNKHFTYFNNNGSWIATQSPVDTINWNCMYQDKLDSSFWVGASKRLYHFTKKFILSRIFTESDGLLGVDIFNIMQDAYGDIWLKTFNRIEHIDRLTGRFRPVPKEINDLINHQLTQDAAYIDADNNLLLGKTGSFERIQIANIVQIPPSRIYFKTIDISHFENNRSSSLNTISTLNLKYSQNNIYIETEVIDFFAHKYNELRYRLLNYDSTWHNIPANYSIRYNNLSPGDYKLEIQASNGYHEWDQSEKTLWIHISPAFWNTIWFRTMALVSIISLFYLILRYRWQQKIRLHKLQAEAEKQIMELRQRTTNLELQALRAQMNPHFIFNCLNSINRFIMLNEPEVAADYLTKFSRLIRHVLNNSQQSAISLDEELESLDLFLQMEKLRFSEGFQYNIHCSEDLAKSDIFIPPMLLQPFAENAVWHGLMHKMEPGKLNVDISRENGHLVCVLTDNGIGRKKSAEYGANSPVKRKSYGLQLTKERLYLWNKKLENTSYLEIEDLEDNEYRPLGTRITLRIRYVDSNEDENDPQFTTQNNNIV